MNKQIKALFANAVGAEGTMLPDFSPETTVTITIADLGMFAELIVNECASLLPETDGDIGGTYRDKIKEHFGVE